VVIAIQTDNNSGYVLPGAIAVQPEVILMDEPASARQKPNPRIEEYCKTSKSTTPLSLSPYNMQQSYGSDVTNQHFQR